MTIPFAHRPPSSLEMERFRLIFSTFQDGSGQLRTTSHQTLPGWRDFERSVAAAFGGEGQESKYVFDVVLTDIDRPGVKYGLSCKMRGTLDQTAKTGQVTIELSNSSGEFWAALSKHRINQKNYRRHPEVVGEVLIKTVEKWHKDESIENKGAIDLTRSYYLALSWNKSGFYRLFQFPLSLPDPSALEWKAPDRQAGAKRVPGRRIVGYHRNEMVFEWYGESGGQLKYYPRVDAALWVSNPFRLEPLPGRFEEYGLVAKAASYFPDRWAAANSL